MNIVESIPIHTAKIDPTLQASKWLQTQLLIDVPEMQQLLDSLGDFNIFMTGTVCNLTEGHVPKSKFLEVYSRYISELKAGRLPQESEFRPYFSTVFTKAADHLFRIVVAGQKQIIRPLKPVVQLQLHRLDYSPVDGKFRPMVFSKDSVFWGLQFSYPQLYQDTSTKEVFQVGDTPEYPNTGLFRSIQKWIRHHTIPTPFVVGETQINVPMRLGKQCLNWINNHPQFPQKGFKVLTASIKESS